MSVFLQRVLGKGHDTWIHQLMLREMSDPTPALDLVVEQVMKPRIAYLCGIIGELIGCPPESALVMRCALSVQSQFNSMLWSQAVARMMHVADVPAADARRDRRAHHTVLAWRDSAGPAEAGPHNSRPDWSG